MIMRASGHGMYSEEKKMLEHRELSTKPKRSRLGDER